MRTKAAPNLSYNNIDINKYIPKRSDNRWLKGIANTNGSGYYHTPSPFLKKLAHHIT